MVVDRHCQCFFRLFLANHVVVKVFFELGRGGQSVRVIVIAHHRLRQLIANDVVAQVNAFIANEHRRARNELFDLVLALSAERAEEVFIGGACFLISHALVPYWCLFKR